MSFSNQFLLYLLVTTYVTTSAFAATCSRYEWKCENGRECINSDELCDGFPHCSDKSDETSRACIAIRCPSYAFRCAYGACVDSDSECNKVRDCVDNSDELSINCPGILPSYDIKGDCATGNFKCKSGECILEDKVCDGQVNCRDGSDEKIERCAAYFCPSFGFRCGYGACIDGSAKCDGRVDCADSSDESPALCGFSTNTTQTTTVRPIVNPSTGDSTACWIPNDLPDPVRIFYEASNYTNEIPKGSYAVPFSSINYKCTSNHVLEGNTNNFCDNGKWTDSHPSCRKYCSPLPLSGVTITVTCEILGATVPCGQAIPPQTIAKINCALGYRRPDRVVYDVLRCDEDGEWDYQPFRCEQICGEEAPDIVPYIVGGRSVNITKVPWHLGIYTSVYSSNRSDFVQICGGTIISAKLIVSAAHCFWDLMENRFYEPEYYRVAAGKYYRDFNAVEPIKSQIMKVAQIIHPKEYNDYAGHFAQDIALLTLVNHVIFNSYIKPICMENLDYHEKYVTNGLTGQVAGWGLETSGGVSSPVLKYIDIPTVDYNVCKEELGPQLQVFITGDKFCGGYTTGQSVCQGDSGGGFVYSKMVGGRKLFFLRGIVSTGGNKQNSCDNDKYSLFTNIQYHLEFITYHDVQNRPR